ncbi:MAG: phosphoribosylamine--glycine ligase [Planctomycetota bacterium]|nr:MAG: phosphoribosylamine--glycine ligase [Planctomycetota bacterium]REJ96230.1 MAG: phosphoribosylamine--glycine ligase [Planctomycetota bacterium]REK31487.1 MAG: phosphoribosylamine--glycine ligase [Planctomycetota bacterium]REK40717.1 MAG: phosphoribosylamine--glycine ligase [Planctomycetota bacterium]
MNVLVVGSGGREHALAWKLAQSPRADRVFVAPGNAGTAQDAENVDIPADDIERLIKFAKENKVALTVVGPEAPLCAGISDAFAAEGLRVFGPSHDAAQLEGSKVFCKKLLRRADVPTADYRSFRTAESAITYLQERESGSVVVKADGLAAGKGVMVCDTKDEAVEAVKRIFHQREFGAAGDQLIIEERLEGQEASLLAITDGRTLVTLPAAQDHKPAFDGDRGPNTGGMGAYCPAPLVDEKLFSHIEEQVLVPTIHAMKRSRFPFRGVLYAGLMITAQGPKVLEYNVRFGDPECQPLLMRLRGDLLDVLEAAVDVRLDELPDLEWDPRPAVCVVMASEGYPGEYEKGRPIRGLDEAAKLDDVKVFHAGTATLDDQVITDGGRVLGVTALGESVAAAKLQAYKAVKCIRWDGAWCRKDISDKAIASS